ncbi:MAG: molybdopterin molybdotransferase MoeA, partial [Pseudomonadota bacterium]
MGKTSNTKDNDTNCMADFDPGSLLLNEALERVLDTVPAGRESVERSLDDAFGCALAEDLSASMDVPPFPASAMDGFAIAYRDDIGETRFRMVGKSLAGRPFDGAINDRECVKITTGAALPCGVDTVIPHENATVDADAVTFNSPVKAGQFVRAPGSDTPSGTLLISAGTRLRYAETGILASQGIDRVSVIRKPRVAVMSTGDELAQPGEVRNYGQIFDSNRPLLKGLLAEMGLEVFDCGAVPDDPEQLRHAF